MFVDKNAAGMDKLQTTSEVESVSDTTTFVTKAIQALLRHPDGLVLVIDGEDGPRRLVGGIVTKVRVSSAWVAFSYDECTLKTKEFEDRAAFLKFLTEGGTSKHIHFTRVGGVLLRPAEKEEEKKSSGFLPRSRTFGRTIRSAS